MRSGEANDYERLVDRQRRYLDAGSQRAVAGARVLIAGCGLGALAAILLARTGFTRFLLADGDAVEHSNLNRQPFVLDDLGRNKAEATAERIRGVNPDAEIDTLPRMLGPADLPSVVEDVDVVLNTVDFYDAFFLDLEEQATARGARVLFPLNVGFGPLVVAFDPGEMTMAELVGLDRSRPEEFVARVVRVLIGAGVPIYIDAILREFASASPPEAAPQTGIGAWLTAAVLAQGAVARVLGEPFPVAPLIVRFDLRDPLWMRSLTIELQGNAEA